MMSGLEELSGVYASTIVPLRDDRTIDEGALAAHVAGVASTPGMRGLLINGHAGENFVLTPAEKRRVVEVVRGAVGAGTVLISGVNAEASAEAAAEAKAAEDAGADAILVFPPFSWAYPQHPDVAVLHHQAVIEATRIPIMLYQAPVGTGPLAYSPEQLGRLVRLPRIAAIKEGSWEVARYEANLRLVRDAAPDVLVMPSGDEHLFTCFALGGGRGTQVSIASIAPEIVIALYQSVEQGDFVAARAAHERIYPLARAIYGTAPSSLATARIKACLKLLGRLESDLMRLPIPPLDDAERSRLSQALSASGLL